MARSSSKDKPRKSIKLPPGKQKQFESTLADLQAHYSDLLANWAQMPQAQRDDVLAHSLVLRGYVALFGQAGGTT